MTEGLSPETLALFGLPDSAADPALIPLIASLREAISGMSEIDVTGIEPMSDAAQPRGWSGVGV